MRFMSLRSHLENYFEISLHLQMYHTNMLYSKSVIKPTETVSVTDISLQNIVQVQ